MDGDLLKSGLILIKGRHPHIQSNKFKRDSGKKKSQDEVTLLDTIPNIRVKQPFFTINIR